MTRPERALTTLVLALLVLDIILAAFAWRLGAERIRDGAGSVTDGYNILFSLLATMLVAGFWTRWRISRKLLRATQVFALGAVATHALGHLAGWYYTWRPFDDVLHVTITGSAALLALRHAQAFDLFPARHSTKLRAALVVLVAALAIAAVWEVFEYTMDTTQSTREQDDLADTMQDIIDGAIGGALAASYAYVRPKPSTVRTPRHKPTRRIEEDA